jgi:hypothetical protein
MNTTLTGGDLLGWFKFDKVYDFSKNIDAGVYAFGVFPEVPDKTQLPISLPGVLYIGQSGGQEKTFDKKDKNSGRGYLVTSFHKRMKTHVAKDKIKLIRENMNPDHVLCVYIITPKKYMDEKTLKSWLLSSESELIGNYSLIFGDAPKYNFAHQTNKSLTKENSYSQLKVEQIKQNSIEKFYS